MNSSLIKQPIESVELDVRELLTLQCTSEVVFFEKKKKKTAEINVFIIYFIPSLVINKIIKFKDMEEKICTFLI